MDQLLSTFASNCNLRRYTEGAAPPAHPHYALTYLMFMLSIGQALQVDPITPKLRAPGYERLKLKYDEPPSILAFNFNSRHYASESCATSLIARFPSHTR